MAYKVQPGVIGCAIRQAPGDNAQRSLEEAIYDTVQAALADAGIDIDDIDGIVVASNDQYDGRAISVMMASGPVGGVDRDILSTPSASEHAFVMGALRVASGHYRTHLVVSWSPTEASSLPEVERLGADPYFHRILPLDQLSSHALQAAALEAKTPGLDELATQIAARNRRHGEQATPAARPEPGAARWPLAATMTSQPIAGVVAMVLASPEFVADRKIGQVAWLHGMGWATETGFLGDRDLSTAPALESAARQAYAAANIEEPAGAFDVIELTDATPWSELLAYEALGLCAREDWAGYVASSEPGREGATPLNPSGGVLTHNPVFCTGLIRIAEIANQILGRAGNHQIAGARRGLAHAASGFAMQYQTAVVLGSEQGAAA